jgi:methyltransferase
VLLVATGAERLVELRVSARNRAALGQADQASPSTYPLMVAVHVALFAVSAWPRRGRRVSRPVQVVALVGLAASAGLRVWVIRTLGAEWNVTAHVRPDAHVETGGPYRYVRHPNYVAVALEFACLPTAVGAIPEAVVLSLANVAVLVPRIRAEERLLDAIPGYRDAFRGVPRFIPRPGRHSRQIPTSDSQSRGDSSRKV